VSTGWRAATAPQGRASALQGWVLVSCGWLAVMASAMLSPVLPSMTAYFSAVRSVDLQVSLVASLPALFVALLAWPFGILGDRIGHKRVLCWASACYGFVGTAPLWLSRLPEIVAARALVGIAEAAIMTCSTTLLGAYFQGERRARYLALQTGTAPLAAVTVIAIGGALGEASWRAPFLARLLCDCAASRLAQRRSGRSRRQSGRGHDPADLDHLGHRHAAVPDARQRHRPVDGRQLSGPVPESAGCLRPAHGDGHPVEGDTRVRAGLWTVRTGRAHRAAASHGGARAR